MATVQTMNGTLLVVQIGNAASPEVFAADCLINAERGITFESETNEFIVPDCTSPDNMAWKEVTKDGLKATITGSGMMHTTTFDDTWFQWFTSSGTKNVRVLMNVALAVGGGYWSGAFHCTQLEVTGNRNEKTQANITLVSDGVVTWTDAAA